MLQSPGPTPRVAAVQGTVTNTSFKYFAKYLRLVIDCVRGAAPFMSCRTIYALKEKHMAPRAQLSSVLTVKDGLEAWCGALTGKWERTKLQDGFGISCTFSSLTARY